MKVTGDVLVATDLGSGSDEAVRQGATIARLNQVPWIACVAVPDLLGSHPLFPEEHGRNIEQSENALSQIAGAVNAQIDRVLGAERGDAEVRLEAGSPATVLLEVANEMEASLIVVGRRADSSDGPLGGVAEVVARHAPSLVMIASARRGKVVLAATDFSDPALPAVSCAQQEAARRNLPLVIVHVVDLQTGQIGQPEVISPALIDSVIQMRHADAQKQLAKMTKPGAYSAKPILREGLPKDEILAVAEEIDAEVIVLGTHGRTGLDRLVLGSVAEGVMRRATCSVIVVRLAKGS